MLHAAAAGVLRMIEVIKGNYKETFGSERAHSAWGRHVEGSMAEYAMSRCAGVPWDGPGTVFGPDIGKTTEIRCAERGRLILHPKDLDHWVAWFVLGGFGSYRVVGWIPIAEGKKREYWSDPQKSKRWAFFVPNEVLRTPDSYDWSKHER